MEKLLIAMISLILLLPQPILLIVLDIGLENDFCDIFPYLIINPCETLQLLALR